MVSDIVVIDAGPLVALLNERDQFHLWSIAASKKHNSSYFTTEAVLSEAFFLLGDHPKPFESLLSLLDRGSIHVLNMCTDHIADITKLMRRYADQPMSLADAALVRLAEMHDRAAVFTTDRHFTIYRKNGRQSIPLIAPWTNDR